MTMDLGTDISGDRILQKSLPLSVAGLLGTPVRLKTWSLIVTFFGDAVLPRGGSISAISLGQVMEAIGIESGAVRTAISRLASDGWIERERDGRASFYRLAARRERSFIDAGKLIYASEKTAKKVSKWAIGCAAPDQSLSSEFLDHVLTIQKNWFLVDLNKIRKNEIPENVMLFEGNVSQSSDWFSKLVAPPELHDAMCRHIDVFTPVKKLLDQPDGGHNQISSLDALALRSLLIHEWRRIALRLHPVPKTVLPSDWPEAECRQLVAQLYRLLLVPSEIWLDEEARCISGAMPKALEFQRTRFI